MKIITIYTTIQCPFCEKAILLFKKKKWPFIEKNVANDKERAIMIKRSAGMHTVPQIFFDDKHIGGCDKLYELESQGKLEKILFNN